MAWKISSAFSTAVHCLILAAGLMLGNNAAAEGRADLSLSSMAHEADDYRLGAGDVVRISVFNFPELAIETRISETGNVTFPLIGSISIMDLTAFEAEAAIAGRLRQGGYIREPHVTVVVSQYKAREVAVLGEVRNPGKYPIQKRSTVVDMLSAAGGVSGDDAADSATLLHANGDKIAIDLKALFNGSPSQNPVVFAGDTLFVPKAPQFYIYGEVQHPGAYKLERNLTVTQAISKAGGLTPRGTDNWPSPLIKRRTVDGQEEKTEVDGSYVVQPDEVLYVRERWF